MTYRYQEEQGRGEGRVVSEAWAAYPGALPYLARTTIKRWVIVTRTLPGGATGVEVYRVDSSGLEIFVGYDGGVKNPGEPRVDRSKLPAHARRAYGLAVAQHLRVARAPAPHEPGCFCVKCRP